MAVQEEALRHNSSDGAQSRRGVRAEKVAGDRDLVMIFLVAWKTWKAVGGSGWRWVDRDGWWLAR